MHSSDGEPTAGASTQDQSQEPSSRDNPWQLPELYFTHTSPDEQIRHQKLIQSLPSDGTPLVEALQLADGHWQFELVTLDWDEPGLLDKIFEVILRCYKHPAGVSIIRVRTFTGGKGHVITLLQLGSAPGEVLGSDSVSLVLDNLRTVRQGGHGVLEIIQHMPSTNLIPLIREIPVIDNERSDKYTCIRMEITHLSNRFTSVLLHHLARSELWLNIQVAIFQQGGKDEINGTGTKGHYEFYVVDKQGHKLSDTSVMRLSMVRTLTGINDMLIRYNTQLITRKWRRRIEANQHTIYHSRPRFSDYLDDLDNIRAMANLKGFEWRLSHMVEEGLLESRSFYFLKKVESFVIANLDKNRSLGEEELDEDQVELTRSFFEFRRLALRIIMPLFEKLSTMPSRNPPLSDRLRLLALCRPLPQQDYALDDHDRLYIDGPLWLGEPSRALEPFHLLARTECYLHQDTLEAVEATLEGWNEFYIAEHRRELGRLFLTLFDESIRQNNTGIVLRNMRTVGLLQRYLPGFSDIKGRIHLNADHSYTVDEHSFMVIDILQGLSLMGEVMPLPGKLSMRTDYEKLKDAAGLLNFSRKYAMELRILDKIALLRVDPAARPFFRYMDEVRSNRLEYLVEANLLEHGYETCMAAMTEIEKLRNQMDELIRAYRRLDLSGQRLLVLAGLLHDLKKPAVNHDELGGEALPEVLAQMGLELPPEEVSRLSWLISNHLAVRPLMNRMASEGNEAIWNFAREAGDLPLVRLLIVFTYADRVAVHFERNKNSNDAMVLGGMLQAIKELESERN
ncbi:MAG: hypothetical protein OEZ59_03210 [Deltaproteobacteria bacterium]|nr:hypothetical protein [Deltaproteobacteria bacterium]